MPDEQALFDDGDTMQHGADGKCRKSNTEQVFPLAHQRKNRVQQADRVQGRGHSQPDDTHFSHGERRKKGSKYQYSLACGEATGEARQGLTPTTNGRIVKVEMEAKPASEPSPQGSYLEGGSYIEPVHNKGGYRLSPLTGC